MQRKFQRAALAAATGIVLVSGAQTALAQNSPVAIDDVMYGLNRSAAAETVQQVRGTPVGTKTTSTWSQGFIQSIQLDNYDGFRHAYDGNMLGVNFGSAATGGLLYNLQTRLTPGDPTPGISQPLFDFTTYNTANPGSPLAISRLAGVSVNPNNSRIALTGNDTGNVYVLDYNAGAAGGTGAGATVSNGRQVTTLVAGASNTRGSVWLDNDNVLARDNSGTLKRVTVGAGGALSSATVGAVPFPAATAASSSLAYEPNLS